MISKKYSKNAITLRYERYMDLNFDYKFDPIGGKIQHYLLEKSGVIKQQIGERNFHAFYQLLSNENSLQEYGFYLKSEDYYYINQGSCCKIDRIDDNKIIKKLLKHLILLVLHKMKY